MKTSFLNNPLVALVSVLLAVSSVFVVLESVPKNSVEDTTQYASAMTNHHSNPMVDSQPISRNPKVAGNYGCNSDGEFFIKTSLVGDAESLVLCVMEDARTTEATVFERREYTERVKMLRVGDYFVGRPTKQYAKAAYYFNYIEGFNVLPLIYESLNKTDVVYNQYDGLMLRKS